MLEIPTRKGEQILEFYHKFFSKEYMPHGMCYLWDPAVLWLSVISDSLIAAAYYAIPFLMFSFMRKRRDVGFKAYLRGIRPCSFWPAAQLT